MLLALIAHGASLRSGFVYDDLRFVVNNPALETRAPLELVLDAGTHTSDRDRDVYRPLRALGHRFDRARWGLEPFGFHLHSLLVHALCALLTFETVRRLVPEAGPGGAAFAAGVLAAHPLGCEVVDWISSRGDAYGYGLGLCALLAYAAADGAGRARGLACTLGATLAAFAAMLGKESAAALPLVALVHRRLLGRGALAPVLGMGAGVLAALALRQHAVGGASPIQTAPHGGSWAAQLGWALFGTGRTALHVVWPAGLSIEYPQLEWARGAPLWVPDALAGWARVPTLLALGLIALAVALRRRRPVVAFGLAWALLAYLPSSSALVTLRSLVNDRMAYPALAGAGLALAGAPWPRAPRARAVLATLLLAALCGLAMARARVFASEASLWTDALRVAPREVRAHLGLARAAEGDPRTQRRHLERAVEVAPPRSRPAAVARAQLGDLLVHRLDEPEAAIPHLVAALAIGQAERAGGGAVTSHELAAVGALADALARLGRLEDADGALATMIEQAPDVVALRLKRAMLWLGAAESLDDPAAARERARAALNRAAALDPDHPQLGPLRELLRAGAGGG